MVLGRNDRFQSCLLFYGWFIKWYIRKNTKTIRISNIQQVITFYKNIYWGKLIEVKWAIDKKNCGVAVSGAFIFTWISHGKNKILSTEFNYFFPFTRIVQLNYSRFPSGPLFRKNREKHHVSSIIELEWMMEISKMLHSVKCG